jgi:hypothetical protein
VEESTREFHQIRDFKETSTFWEESLGTLGRTLCGFGRAGQARRWRLFGGSGEIGSGGSWLSDLSDLSDRSDFSMDRFVLWNNHLNMHPDDDSPLLPHGGYRHLRSYKVAEAV